MVAELDEAWVELCPHGELLFSSACQTCWPVPEEMRPAFAGIAGDVVRAIAPHSEVHPAGLLLTTLAILGNEIGPSPHIYVGQVRHRAQLFVVLVGETSVARKGQTHAEVAAIMDGVSPGWSAERVFSGFGSGEGIIARLAERMAATEPEAIRDRRLLLHEGEFASILRVAGRDGSTLSTTIRDAWDGRTLQNNVKQSRLVAPTGHLVSVEAHTTLDEVTRELHSVDVANGFANRFLFCKVRRTRLIAVPKRMDVSPLVKPVLDAIVRAQQIGPVGFTDRGQEAWEAAYAWLEGEADRAAGLVGPLIARGSAHTLRLALTYAVLDGRAAISSTHVESALAVWRYCAASVREIFGASTGDPVADRIRDAVARSPDGLTMTEVHKLLQRNYKKSRIEAAVASLARSGGFMTEERQTGGRSATVIRTREVRSG